MPAMSAGVVGGIPFVTSAHAALGAQLVQGLIERQQDMRRRREAELSVLLESFELRQRDRGSGFAQIPRTPTARRGGRSRTQKPGTPSMHLLDDEMRKSMPHDSKSIGMPPKLLIASTMYDRVPCLHDAPDGIDGIEDAGRRLAVHDGDVSDVGVFGQARVDRAGIDRRVLGARSTTCVDSGVNEHLHHAFAVRAVRQHERPSRRRNARLKHGVDAERAAALQ